MNIRNSEMTAKRYDELSILSTKELILKILKLESDLEHLKRHHSQCTFHKQSDKSLRARPFHFEKWPKQHTAFHVLYCGWDYQGYVVQENSEKTVENCLMQAFLKCKLIESRETSNYHRCGRTDKGVSSYGQIISLTVRSSGPESPPLDYLKMLNRVLPPDIRVVSWCPVDTKFSARFDCLRRTYRYFFPLSNLNIKAMNEAAQYLVGEHDFRNLCKMDVANGVTQFVREIFRAEVNLIQCNLPNVETNGYRMCELILDGRSFLWHQVRCIMAVLLMVGQGLESPDIIKNLLDVKQFQRKPQYPMAEELCLNLFECHFECLNWIIDKEEIKTILRILQQAWTQHAIRAQQIKSMLEALEQSYGSEVFFQASALIKKDSKHHKPLLTRDTCKSLEEKLEHIAKKQKVKPDC